MLKTRVAVLITVGVFGALTLLSTPRADAKVACLSGSEVLALAPSGVVTLDTLVVHRSPDSGLFEASLGPDAGSVQFDVNGSTATAPSSQCGGALGAATLVGATPFEPFGPDAGTFTLQVVAR